MAAPIRIVDKDDVKQLPHVQLNDGSVWETGFDQYSRLTLVKEIKPPPPQPGQSQPGQGQPQPGNPEPGSKAADSVASGDTKGHALPKAPGAGTPPVTDRSFVQQLKGVLKDNQFDRVVRHRTRGKIDLKGLPRAAAKREDVFKKKEARLNRKYNVMVVVDESSSMGGIRINTAAKVTQYLANHLQNVEGVRVAVMGFNGDVMHFQRFTDPPQRHYDWLASGIVKICDGGTRGYQALEEAYKEFDHLEGKNILLYLTDGDVGDESERRFATRITKQKDVHTVGIGIQVPARQFPVKIEVNDLKELKPRILGILRSHITRG